MSKSKVSTMSPLSALVAPPSPSGARFSINLHDTLAQDKQINNGKDYPYFVVVKNVPFIVVISSKGEVPVNFKKNAITCSLLYDCTPRREVSLIRSSPLEYVTHVSSNGEEITIEARIHVLTSQHEDSLFRVSVSFNNQEITSDPLKVISKADNLRKPAKNSSSNTTTTIKKKRTASDAFGDTLQRIEQQQQEQRRIIDLLCQQNALLLNQLQQVQPPSPIQQAPSSPSTSSTPAEDAPSKLMDIDTAFTQFINCYANISPEERPQKVRALRKTASEPLMADFTNNFVSRPVLLDEVLGLEPDFFSSLEPEMTQFVPASPVPFSSPLLASESPLSSPEHTDSLDGYWSHSHYETNSPTTIDLYFNNDYDNNNDTVDIDDITDTFISEILLPNSSYDESSCISSC